jgi:hypothetical protein
VYALLGHPVQVDYVPARAGDYAGRPVSADRAHEVLGWTPRTSFEDGLRAYVAWHVENIDDTPVATEVERPAMPAIVAEPVAPRRARRPVRIGLVDVIRSLAIVAAAVAVGFPIGLAESPQRSVGWSVWIVIAVLLTAAGWQRGARCAAGPARRGRCRVRVVGHVVAADVGTRCRAARAGPHRRPRSRPAV